MAYYYAPATTINSNQQICPMQVDQNYQLPYAPPGYQYSQQQPVNNNLYTQFSINDIIKPSNNSISNSTCQNGIIYQQSQPSLTQAQDPEWQLVDNRKRNRKEISDKPLPQAKQTKITNNWLNPTNRYAPLDSTNADKDDETQNSASAKVDPKPPPIFVSGVKIIEPLIKLLESIAKNEYEIKVLHNDEVKIQPKTSDKYRIIVKALTEKKTEFHTFQRKQERTFRAVIKNLHPTTNLDQIKEELMARGHQVTNIWNIKQRNTKKELPLFFIELKPADCNKDIYNIDRLVHSVVKVEPPHVKRQMPQCAKCQRFGHTKNFCNRSPRCVKCTGNHMTSECPRKDRNKDVRCVNCNGNHPANHRGCSVYKELQQRMYPPLRSKQLGVTVQNLTQQAQPNLTHAQVVRGNFPIIPNNTFQPQPNNPSDDISELKKLMKGLMEQMGTILNLLTTLVTKTNNGATS